MGGLTEKYWNTNAIPNSKAAELSFLSNLTGSAIEGFEGIPAGKSNSTTLSGVGATITATNALISGVSNIPYDGTSPSLPAGIVNSRFPIAGSQYYEVGTFNGITTTTITFANPIAAFGFYATDVENSEGITLQLNDSANTVQTISRTTPLLTSGSALNRSKS